MLPFTWMPEIRRGICGVSPDYRGYYFFLGFFAGILRVDSKARLMSADGGFVRQSPGTMT